MNRDALAYLQVSRAASSDKQTLSWTMHVTLRKIPSSTKFLLKMTLVIFATAPRPLSHAHQKFKLADCRTTMQKHCGTSKMLEVRYSYTPSLLVVVGETYTCKCKLQALFLCAKPLKQRTKHHVHGHTPDGQILVSSYQRKRGGAS